MARENELFKRGCIVYPKEVDREIQSIYEMKFVVISCICNKHYHTRGHNNIERLLSLLSLFLFLSTSFLSLS